jgi:hypothetical protein
MRAEAMIFKCHNTGLVLIMLSVCMKVNAQDPMKWIDDEPATGPATTWPVTVVFLLGFVIAFWLSLSERSPLHNWFNEHHGWAAIFLWLFPLVFGFIFASMLR